MVKKILPWIVFSVLFAFLIIGFAMKGSMNNYLSRMMKEHASPELLISGEILIDSLYNYSKNGLSYEITFLEFGAKGCSACKRMESVLEEISTKYPSRVNVKFINILLPENQVLMKYYGIATIPTQVLLDKGRNVFFRNTGYYSTEEMEKEFAFSKK
ncbi:MAG: thioredoxin family protein [Mariniphaga sp.]|nr:thioredoxin family protein [Mariniphaga sp.]